MNQTLDFRPNGVAALRIKRYWRGDETIERSEPVRITPRRIETRTGHRFDRLTGRSISRWSIHVKPRWVVAWRYATDPAGEWREIPQGAARG